MGRPVAARDWAAAVMVASSLPLSTWESRSPQDQVIMGMAPVA